MQIKYISSTSTRPPSLLRKTAAVITTVALAGVALMFSAVLLAAILIVAVFGGAYLWWKMRELRKQMREQMKNFPPPRTNMESGVFGSEVFKGEVIEGTAVRVDTKRDTH